MNLSTDTNSLPRRLAVELNEIGWGQEGFMNGDIGILRVLNEPLVSK